MPLRDLDYQARVLARLDDYFTELSAQKAKADKIIAANITETDPDLIRPVSDLVQEIRVADESGEKTVNGPRSVQRRPALAGTDIYLLRVLYLADDAVRPLDYEQDILFALDWSGLDLAPLIAGIPDNLHAVERQMQRIRLVEPETAGGERFVAELSDATGEATAFDPAYAVRMITEYKQAVLQLMTETFQAGQVDRIGELELVGGDGTQVECDLVLATEWQARLAERLNRSHSE